MDVYYVEADIIQPEVILDKDRNIFKITGKSLLIDAEEFYKPIIDWFKEYAKKPLDSTELNINFEYLNSSSLRRIIEMFVVLEKIKEKGEIVKIKWYYNKNDEIIKEKGEEIKSVVYLPFEIEEKQ